MAASTRSLRLAVCVDKPTTVEVTLVDTSWWGKEVVPEARRAVICALHKTDRVKQISCRINSRNFGSAINAVKLGFEQTGVMHMAIWDKIRNQPEDYVLFSLRGKALDDAVAKWSSEGSALVQDS